MDPPSQPRDSVNSQKRKGEGGRSEICVARQARNWPEGRGGRDQSFRQSQAGRCAEKMQGLASYSSDNSAQHAVGTVLTAPGGGVRTNCLTPPGGGVRTVKHLKKEVLEQSVLTAVN